MLLLMVNSTIGHLPNQSFWSFDTTVHSIWAIDLLACFVAPSVWGWNAVDMRSLLPNSLCSSLQNMEVNLVSRSDTIDSGIPWSLMTSFSINHATPLVVTIIIVGTRCTCDVSQSIMTNKWSELFDFGSGPMKSSPIDCHGLSGICRLCSRPVGLLFVSLLVAQVPHVCSMILCHVT